MDNIKRQTIFSLVILVFKTRVFQSNNYSSITTEEHIEESKKEEKGKIAHKLKQ
jgi:hypothetical protein